MDCCGRSGVHHWGGTSYGCLWVRCQFRSTVRRVAHRHHTSDTPLIRQSEHMVPKRLMWPLRAR